MRAVRRTARTEDSASAIRNLRDLLRADLLEYPDPTAMLPDETELMLAYCASRGTVRGALALLRQEGLINRVQGVGTFLAAQPTQAHLVGTTFRMTPADESSDNPRGIVRPSIIYQGVVPLPLPVARRLRVALPDRCMRLEAVMLHLGGPTAVVTNHTLFPEAEQLLYTPYRSDWHAYLDEAGVDVGDSEYRIGSVAADEGIAALLALTAGAPLTLVEQITYDPGGRPFNFAVMYFRSDRVMFTYRANGQPGLSQRPSLPSRSEDG